MAQGGDISRLEGWARWEGFKAEHEAIPPASTPPVLCFLPWEDAQFPTHQRAWCS